MSLPTPNSSFPDPSRQTNPFALPAPAAIPERGLLEQPVLVLCPWINGARAIRTPSGSPSGFATRIKPRNSWVGRSTLAVYETENEDETAGQSPLVFTIQKRGWLFRRFEVLDAEGDLVGVYSGGWIHDRFDHPVIQLLSAARQAGQPAQAGHDTFSTPGGRLLGRWKHGENGVELRFEGDALYDPFARMLVLAVTLQTA